VRASIDSNVSGQSLPYEGDLQSLPLGQVVWVIQKI